MALQGRHASPSLFISAAPSASVMHPLMVLGLLLSCTVSLSSSTVILENDMPIGWAQTMGSVSEMPTQDGVATPNPFNYLHRFSFSRLITDATSPFMISMGPNPTDSPMWSLALQLVWMHASGKKKMNDFHWSWCKHKWFS